MKTARFTFVALGSLLLGSGLVSCGKDTPQAPPAEMGTAAAQLAAVPSDSDNASDAGGMMMDQLRNGCPMVVDGTEVTVADTESGVALTFATTTGDVGDLRTRVRQMTQMYGMQRGKAGMMWHSMRGMGGAGMGMRGMGGAGMGMRGMGGAGMGTGGAAMTGQGMGTGGAGMGMGTGGAAMTGQGMGMGTGGAGMGMAANGPMPAASATMTETDKGARLELTPSDASQLVALREHVRAHQQRMHSGECWMRQDQAAAAPTVEKE